MPADLYKQQFGLVATAALGLTYPKLLRTQLERKTFVLGVPPPPPRRRWTFSIADVLFLRCLNYLTGLGWGADPVRVAPYAQTLADEAGKVWKGTLPADHKWALGFETHLSISTSAPAGQINDAWVNGSDRWCRMMVTVPVGRIVQEVREAIAKLRIPSPRRAPL